jgi:hypothetical protein
MVAAAGQPRREAYGGFAAGQDTGAGAAVKERLGFTRLPGMQQICGSRKIWRRERDSNPRYPLRYTRFRGARLQPLGHLSA